MVWIAMTIVTRKNSTSAIILSARLGLYWKYFSTVRCLGGAILSEGLQRTVTAQQSLFQRNVMTYSIVHAPDEHCTPSWKCTYRRADSGTSWWQSKRERSVFQCWHKVVDDRRHTRKLVCRLYCSAHNGSQPRGLPECLPEQGWLMSYVAICCACPSSSPNKSLDPRDATREFIVWSLGCLVESIQLCKIVVWSNCFC